MTFKEAAVDRSVKSGHFINEQDIDCGEELDCLAQACSESFFRALFQDPVFISRIQFCDFFNSGRICFSAGIKVFEDSYYFQIFFFSQFSAVGDLSLHRF